MKGIKPRLLIIDSVSAYYWADRCVRSGGATKLHGPLGTRRAHESLTEDVSLAVSRYEIVVLATTATRGTHSLNGSRGEIMSPSWQQIVSNRLMLDLEGNGRRTACWETAPSEYVFCKDEAFVIRPGGIEKVLEITDDPI